MNMRASRGTNMQASRGRRGTIASVFAARRLVAILFVSILALGGTLASACSSAVPIIDEPDAAPSVTPSATVTGSVPPKPTTSAPLDPDIAKAPIVTSVSPDKALVGGVGPSIVVTGNNFVARSVIQLDGAPLATTFISATELRGAIPSNKLLAVGTLRISVGTAPPGGGASKELTFEVQNPAPALTQLSPLSAVAGSPTLTLTLAGTSFVPGAKVAFGTTDLTTTFTSATELSATVPAALLATSGSFPIKVTNPAPGGGPSTTIAFTVTNPNVVLTRVTPAMSTVGSAAVPITLDGSGFLATTQVLFNGVSITKAFVSATQLTATVPATSLTAAGEFPITVQNPPPGGGLSAPVVFRVQYSAPVLAAVAPTSVAAGSAATVITVTGSSFYAASQVTFDNVAAPTSFVDGGTLRATLPAAAISAAGAVSVRVVNPAPGGGTSSAASITVQNPAPIISSLSPSSGTVGSADRAISVLGTGFVATSVVRINGVAATTTFVNATQLTTTISSSYMTNPGTVAITVMTPTPGGGTSAASNFTVGCDTVGVDVPLGALNNTTTIPTLFTAAPTETGFQSAAVCPGFLSAMVRPVRYWVVQNTSGQPVTLSAWAVCTGDGARSDDGFISLYKRGTKPVSVPEREGCVGAIAEGLDGPGAFSAPEPDRGGAVYCPGLTKANGGGLALGVCEKAVVRIQPYSMTDPTFTPPPQIRMRPE